MSLWLNAYLRAIEERDSKEKANESLFDTYTRLADRAADLASFPPVPVPPEPTTAPAPLVARIESSSDGKKASREPPRSKASRLFSKDGTTATSLDVLAKVREDLGEAQRSKGVMQAQLQSLNEEVAELRAQSQLDKRRIRELSVEKTNLVKRMRDLDEELKGKAKLLEHIHDETISLELQLNMAEAQSRKLKQENKELIDRWMARMGEEAEAMNKASKFS